MIRPLRLAAVLLAVAVAPAPAYAARHRTPPSHSQAVAALERAKDLSAGRGIRTGRELSPALAALAAAIPALHSDERTQARALLARPDDTQPDPQGTHKWSAGALNTAGRFCSAHFCIHWVKTSQDAPDLTNSNADPAPDYVEQMAAIFENEVFPCENGGAAGACGLADSGGGSLTGSAPGLSWKPAAADGTLGGDDRLDVYIQNLFPDGIFGYVAADPDQTRDPTVPHHVYMVMDKDYSRFANGSATGGLADERVTAAHEYNHALQNAYDFLEDIWMFESTAVWMEDKVYPQINDYFQYIPDWANLTSQPLTTFTNANFKGYGSAVWNHFLDHRYGAGAVRAAWESSVAAGDFAPGAYQQAIAAAGGAGFSDEFDRLAAAVTEWRAPGSGFPDPYPDVARNGSLPVGNVTAPVTLPHTTFALFDVPIPDPSVPVIRLTTALPAGVAGAVALVGRTGADPGAGTVTSNLTPLPTGGSGAVSLDAPAGFGRITAVVVNSDIARTGFDQASGDWLFTHDNVTATAQLDGPGPPVPVTGALVTVGDHSAQVSGTVDPHLLDTTWSVDYGTSTLYGSRTAVQPLAASVLMPAPVTATLTDLAASTTYHYRLVASNAAGGGAGADVTFQTAPDVTAPNLIVTASKRQKLKKVRRSGVAFSAQVSEPTTGNARVEVARRDARKLKLPRALGTLKLTLRPGAKPVARQVRLSRAVSKKLAKVRKLNVTLVVGVADPSGNRATARRRVLLSL